MEKYENNFWYLISMITSFIAISCFLIKQNVALKEEKADLLHEKEMLKIELKTCELNKPLEI
jgi:hypothetical protein